MITLYTVPTGNGYRASILLEESGLAYTARTVAFADLKSPEFLSVNPIGKAPAIVDDDPAGGGRVAIGESLAIALYVAEKSGRLMPDTAADRATAAMWGTAVVAGLGGAITAIFHARTIDAAVHAPVVARHFADIDTHLRAIEQALAGAPYLGGQAFSWADAILAPMILSTLPKFDVALDGYPALCRWRDTVAQRPGVQAGLRVPA